ncbi:amidase [Paraburkholderia fungorum]|uniref:Amidase n=1 Tax=Paraburkholderia fungorum TaxID=134537 RepID=A0A420FC54_9BURK|nr:amidase [Paraburkholderia fungorum]RKF30550.1 amidase [Paraburkholderia fungorum]
MTNFEWQYKSVREMASALAAREISACELAEAAIARIESLDPKLNAVCVRDFDRARDAARAADHALATGERRPLLGIPLLVKESFNVAGLPTTWGFPQHKNFVPTEDALPVARVKAAGAVILGKTNVPFGLGDWQSYNDIYGTTSNPYDLTRSPGGSSGGSAAALAAGYVPLALGSDLGGSLRMPAHFCGVYAHKPTLGVVPARGHVPPPYAPLPDTIDLAVVGPMARCAADLALLFDVMAGPDEIDTGIAYRLDMPAPRHDRLSDFRVLVLDRHPLLPTDSAVRLAIGTLAEHLEGAGVRVAYKSELLPDLGDSALLYMRMLMSLLALNWPADVYANLQKQAAAMPREASGLDAERVRGAVLSHRDWIVANNARCQLRAQWREFFKAFDALICPVSPVTAFSHDHSNRETRQIVIDGEPHPYGNQLIWPGVATLPGLPATSIPIGMSAEGLPIGVQIVGPAFEDRTPLKLAQLIEAEFGGFVPPADF